ncbi:MAG: DsbA family protein [Dyadobacter sp.]|uniref:DsbA family protein n=1 Tax=Dyadobacter sp. TaxID=1914288 RepID=UPI001B25FEC8|nr:DsbA family protein [Dyadobacter sp.]MBO9616551.1 DsbA family protein [Dyadobacter sp.]
MKPIDLNRTIVNIVYYTQPLCPVSWRMQQHWHEFTTKFSELINVRFCLATFDATSRNPRPGHEPSNIKACQAVKAVSLQSQRAADLYLNALRKAALHEGQDISLPHVLVDLAREISRENRGILDLQKFGTDFDSSATRRALQNDALKIRTNKIDSCPTITFTVNGGGIKATGFLSFQQLAAMLKKALTRI